MRDSAVDVLVVVVNFRSADLLATMLDGLPAALDGLRATAVVVDNSGELLAAGAAALPGAPTLLGTGENLGFAGGVDVALRAPWAAEHVLLVNPDARLVAGSVRRLVECARIERAAAVVPRILDHEGRDLPTLRRFPSVLGAIGDAVVGWSWRGRPRALSEYLLRGSDYEHRHVVDWAQGSVVLVRGDVVRALGDWDESFFLYSEETDYFDRLHRGGWRAVVEPAATAVHAGGGSGTSALQVLLLHLNRIELFRRGHGPLASAAYRAAVLLGLLLRSRRRPERETLRRMLAGADRDAVVGELRRSSRATAEVLP